MIGKCSFKFRSCFERCVSRAQVCDVAETGEQRRQDEQVQQRRGDQAAEDHEGHRVFNFLAGFVARHDQRDERETGCQSSHQNRGEAFGGASDDQVRAERNSLFVLQVSVMIDQHDAVSRGDSEDRHEVDQRAERDHSATGKRSSEF